MTRNTLPHPIMPEFVLTLLAREEGSTLEFKRKPYAIYVEDAREKERQRGEMIKDLLALANGNAITAGDTVYLIGYKLRSVCSGITEFR